MSHEIANGINYIETKWRLQILGLMQQLQH